MSRPLDQRTETIVFDSQLTNGVEASLDAKLTDQWHLLANATAMNAVITAAPQAVTTVGNHPQGVPAYMANLWTTYKFSIGGMPDSRSAPASTIATRPTAIRPTSIRFHPT